MRSQWSHSSHTLSQNAASVAVESSRVPLTLPRGRQRVRMTHNQPVMTRPNTASSNCLFMTELSLAPHRKQGLTSCRHSLCACVWACVPVCESSLCDVKPVLTDS